MRRRLGDSRQMGPEPSSESSGDSSVRMTAGAGRCGDSPLELPWAAPGLCASARADPPQPHSFTLTPTPPARAPLFPVCEQCHLPP